MGINTDSGNWPQTGAGQSASQDTRPTLSPPCPGESRPRFTLQPEATQLSPCCSLIHVPVTALAAQVPSARGLPRSQRTEHWALGSGQRLTLRQRLHGGWRGPAAAPTFDNTALKCRWRSRRCLAPRASLRSHTLMGSLKEHPAGPPILLRKGHSPTAHPQTQPVTCP